jgi:hypothetical protein
MPRPVTRELGALAGVLDDLGSGLRGDPALRVADRLPGPEHRRRDPAVPVDADEQRARAAPRLRQGLQQGPPGPRRSSRRPLLLLPCFCSSPSVFGRCCGVDEPVMVLPVRDDRPRGGQAPRVPR